MLNQPTTARYHLNRAIRADPALAMTRVDLSQNLMHSGRTQECIVILDEALLLCKHVSEIKDVMTAREVARIQLELTESGLYIPPLL
jgi:predicted Zn-dependent protease